MTKLTAAVLLLVLIVGLSAAWYVGHRMNYERLASIIGMSALLTFTYWPLSKRKA